MLQKPFKSLYYFLRWREFIRLNATIGLVNWFKICWWRARQRQRSSTNCVISFRRKATKPWWNVWTVSRFAHRGQRFLPVPWIQAVDSVEVWYFQHTSEVDQLNFVRLAEMGASAASKERILSKTPSCRMVRGGSMFYGGILNNIAVWKTDKKLLRELLWVSLCWPLDQSISYSAARMKWLEVNVHV